MKRLRRLEIIATGTAILLLAVIAAVFFLEWSPAADSINNLGTGAETAADAIPTRQAEPTEQAEPIEQAEPVEAAETAWMTTWPIEVGETRLSATGMAYGEVDGNGRLFVANGYQGIQRFSKTGEDLGPISIVDPETGQAVFVRDVVWSPLLWLAPPEYGLIALTDPFESGAYLHIVDPDQGAILRSFEINSNIALPVNATTITATVPTQLATTGTGEIYTDRLYAFPNDSAPDEPNALHYLLRMTLEGRILNSFLIAEQPSTNELPGIVAALTYQPVTDQVVVAVHQGDNGRIDKYNLVRTPQHLVTLDEELIGWQENVALTADDQGLVYILVDNPGYIIEVDQDDEVINMYGFSDMAGVDYPPAFGRFPGRIGRPLAMTITPDGSMLFIVDQKEDGINLTAFSMK